MTDTERARVVTWARLQRGDSIAAALLYYKARAEAAEADARRWRAVEDYLFLRNTFWDRDTPSEQPAFSLSLEVYHTGSPKTVGEAVDLLALDAEAHDA